MGPPGDAASFITAFSATLLGATWQTCLAKGPGACWHWELAGHTSNGTGDTLAIRACFVRTIMEHFKLCHSCWTVHTDV